MFNAEKVVRILTEFSVKIMLKLFDIIDKGSDDYYFEKIKKFSEKQKNPDPDRNGRPTRGRKKYWTH